MDQDLKLYLDQKFAAIDQNFAQIEHKLTEHDQKFALTDQRFTDLLTEIDKRFAAAEEKNFEAMRDMQTELLRGFESFSTSYSIRLRKLEVDHNNMDSAIENRMDTLERRLLQIEYRLMGGADKH